MSAPLQIHSTVPVISTGDIKGSILYYTGVLGFLADFEFGDPVSYAGIRSGEAEIYLAYDVDLSKHIKEKNLHPEVFIWLTDVDSLFKTHTANGANIVDPISNKPWGARQYVIEDLNGYHLKFAQPI